MGTFAGLFAADGAEVADGKKHEFKKRIEKLYQSGGMMEVQYIELFGKSVATICKAVMQEKAGAQNRQLDMEKADKKKQKGKEVVI